MSHCGCFKVYSEKMLHVTEVNNTHVVVCTVYVCAVDLKDTLQGNLTPSSPV